MLISSYKGEYEVEFWDDDDIPLIPFVDGDVVVIDKTVAKCYASMIARVPDRNQFVVDSGEGSKTFVLEGPEDSIKAARNLICSIKGEPALKTVVKSCELCDAKCDYNQKK